MKSLLVIALSAALVFGLCGCGRNKNKETEPSVAPTDPTSHDSSTFYNGA